MPKTQKQRRLACAAAHSKHPKGAAKKMRKTMGKEKAEEWCRAKKLHKGKRRRG